MNIKTMPLGPLQTNCYIVYTDESAIIFDPGGDGEKLVSWLQEVNVTPVAILLTHAHFDHIGAIDYLKEYFQIPVYVHEAEAEWLEDPQKNGSGLFPVGEIKTSQGPDNYIKTGSTTVDGFTFEVRHTPGHSPGGVIFIFHEERYIIGGDSLFQLGIGRTDLPGGDHQQLIDSINNEMFSLADDFTVYPGHGDRTTIGFEKKENPFLN
ncbi:MBL fold metallo-hydrolase [Aquibacillus sediminis]|uniref:MBL fold metallo-hydrolase n=1 Tax=Aquibacillus sediminis TaxID=2574734 RepID=UPI0011094E79|nr:MBL fold metallo-hydrolase [Aquibacillus sediminis]